MKPFEPSRESGQSDRIIILEHVRLAEPGTIFPYLELRTVLQEGTDRHIDNRVIGRAVRQANKELGDENKRTLVVIPTVGYRVAKADEHLSLAVGRKRRAQRQMRTGYDLMLNTRLDEIPEPHRTLHLQQQAMIGVALMAIRSLSQRQNKHEEVIQHLIERVNKIDGGA